MKALKWSLIACSLFAGIAHAQSATTDASASQTVQQTAQNGAVQTIQPGVQDDQQRPVAKSPKKAESCTGPVSFCDIFFGH